MTKSVRILIAAAVLLLSGQGAVYAQTNNDFGVWASAQVNKKWDKPYAFARAELRTCDCSRETEAWFLSAGGGYNFLNWLKADLSYEFWKIPSSQSCVHKGILAVTGTLRSGNLACSLREKYEFAVIQGTGTISHTLRSRLRAQYSAGIFTPYLMYEFFNGFGSSQGWIRSLHYAGSELSLGGGHSLDFFYMYHLYAVAGGTGSRHLLGIGYNFVF